MGSRPDSIGLERGSLVAGRYRVEGPLGRGGMGAVYRVVDTSTDTAMALKLGQVGEEHDAGLRFRREFHTLAALQHPRIVSAFEYGESGDGPFYTMELLDGQDLKAAGPMGPTDACRVLRDVASALAFLHARQLVHRDVASRNIRLTSDGHAKLIDFGVLATVGAAGETAGTPAFLAPENLRGLPVDARTDIYSLGALAYWLLTGGFAYPCRSIDELEGLWLEAAAPPSHIVDEIPPALDELVMAMLCLDPLGRPSSAVEVIDRLNAAVGLPPDEDVELERGYLASAAMVGRREEMQRLRDALDEGLEGRGCGVVIEAESGTGKSRVLREFGLEAQIRGFAVLTTDSEDANRGPFGLFHAIARGLLASAPQEAEQCVGAHAIGLSAVFEDFARYANETSAIHELGDAAEQRLVVQEALLGWLLDVTEHRPIAIAVDDIQRADEASAATLAALARRAGEQRLLVVGALRRGEKVRAAMPVESLRSASKQIALRGLSLAEVQELVVSSFGQARHAPRFAQWLHMVSDGSPLYCTELIRNCVDEGLIRYLDGMWVIPADLAMNEVPAQLADAMETRVAGLSDDARSIGEALSVHGGLLSLPLVVALAGDAGEQRVFSALDELMRQGVLTGADQAYRFRHDGLREALLRGLNDDHRRRLHLRVARAMLRDELPADREADVGWHLYRGGEPSEGAALLERAGRRLFENQALADCLRPLEAAVEIYEERGDPTPRFMELYNTLVLAGFVSNRKVALAYLDRTLAAYRKQSGVDAAERLWFLGKHLALMVGMLWATLAWVLRPKADRGPSPFEAINTFSLTLGYGLGLQIASANPKRVDELQKLADPLAVFKGRLPYAPYIGSKAFPHLARGRYAQTLHYLRQVLEILETDELFPIRDIDRRAARVGIFGFYSWIEMVEASPSLETSLREMEESGLRYYALVAKATQVTNFRLRGEEWKARQLEDDLETETVLLGSWSTDVQITLFAMSSYTLTRDILGLKRSIEAVDALTKDGFHFDDRLAAARADYARERGNIDESRRRFEELIATLAPDDSFILAWSLCGLAETYLAAGRLDDAIETARSALKMGEDPETAQLVTRLRSRRVLSLALAAADELDEAVEVIDVAIEEADASRCPTFAGMAHEARSRIALIRGERAIYVLHRTEVEQWFRATRNPALIGIAERLVDAGALKTDRHLSLAADAVTAAAVTTAGSSHKAPAEAFAELDSVEHKDDAERQRATVNVAPHRAGAQ